MSSKQILQLARMSCRQITTSANAPAKAAGNIPEGYIKLKDIQAKFQTKDGKPVFLKKGAADTIMYQFTMFLSLCGIGGIGKLLFDLSYNKSE